MAMSVVHYPFHNERRRFREPRLCLGAKLALPPFQGLGELLALQLGLLAGPAAQLLQLALRLGGRRFQRLSPRLPRQLRS